MHDQIDELLGAVAIVDQTNVLARILVDQRLEVQAELARQQPRLHTHTPHTHANRGKRRHVISIIAEQIAEQTTSIVAVACEL